jgi:hypothetical protein
VIDLKDFIKGAIREIGAAVREGREELGPVGIAVVPVGRFVSQANDLGARGIHCDGDGCSIALEFDVAVTAESENRANGEGGVKLWVFSASVGGSGTTASSQISRVKFALPIRLMAQGQVVPNGSV